MPKISVLFVSLCVNNGTKLVINISKLVNDKTGWLLNYLHRVALSLFQCIWYNYPWTMITQTQTTGISVLIVSFFFYTWQTDKDNQMQQSACDNCKHFQAAHNSNLELWLPPSIHQYLHRFISYFSHMGCQQFHAVLSSLPLNSPHRKPLYLQTRCMHTCHICHLHSAANPS